MFEVFFFLVLFYSNFLESPFNQFNTVNYILEKFKNYKFIFAQFS